jgi:hypothetical protein
VEAAPAAIEMSGNAFLLRYWRGEVSVLPTSGMYRVETLHAFGGASQFTDWPIALLTEYFLLLQAGTQPRIAYIPQAMVFFRLHDTSWSATNADTEACERASVGFLDRGMALLEHPALASGYAEHAEGTVWLAARQLYLPLSRERAGMQMRRQFAYVMRCLRQAMPHLRRHPVALVRTMASVLAASASGAARQVARRALRG